MPKRGKGGRFVKSHHHHRRSSGTKAIVVRQAAPLVRTRTRTRTVVVRRRSGGGGGGGGGTPLGVKGEITAWSSAMGYLANNNAETYNKIPTFGKLPREAVIGLVAHLLGKRNKHLDRISIAALSVAGYKLGEQKFSLEGEYDD
jgi:hypothetical protein